MNFNMILKLNKGYYSSVFKLFIGSLFNTNSSLLSCISIKEKNRQSFYFHIPLQLTSLFPFDCSLSDESRELRVSNCPRIIPQSLPLAIISFFPIGDSRARPELTPIIRSNLAAQLSRISSKFSDLGKIRDRWLFSFLLFFPTPPRDLARPLNGARN